MIGTTEAMTSDPTSSTANMPSDDDRPIMSLSLVDGVLYVAGEVDASTAPRLDAAVRAFDAGEAEVNLGNVTFFGCAGVRVLVEASRDRNRRLTLVEPSAAVIRTLELAGEQAVLATG